MGSIYCSLFARIIESYELLLRWKKGEVGKQNNTYGRIQYVSYLFFWWAVVLLEEDLQPYWSKSWTTAKRRTKQGKKTFFPNMTTQSFHETTCSHSFFSTEVLCTSTVRTQLSCSENFGIHGSSGGKTCHGVRFVYLRTHNHPSRRFAFLL